MLTRQHNLTDREKRALRRKLQVKTSHSSHTINNGTVSDHRPVKVVREYLAPVKAYYVPTVRGRTGCKLSHEKRLLILERNEKRVAFFAGLGVTL